MKQIKNYPSGPSSKQIRVLQKFTIFFKIFLNQHISISKAILRETLISLKFPLFHSINKIFPDNTT